MALKIISFIFVISLTFGVQNSTYVKTVPFDVNDVIERINQHQQVKSRVANSKIQLSEQDKFLVDTSIVQGPEIARQYGSSVAFDGTNYFVVWQDARNYGCIYGARVEPSGIVIDTFGIHIVSEGNTSAIAVVFGATNYLVLWDDYYRNIYGARVTLDGVVLDTNSIVISTTTYEQGCPKAAFDGTNYFVVWTDRRNYVSTYYDIYGARLNQTGVVLDSNGIAISTAVDGQSSPSIAFDGSNYLVVWQDFRSTNYDIYGARVSQAGVVRDTNGIAICVTAENHNYPSVAFGETNSLVIWEQEQGGIFGTRVNQDGVVLDTTSICISTFGIYSLDATFDGTNYFVVWRDGRGNDNDIYGSRVNQDGVVIDSNGIAISTATNHQQSPCVAFDGENYLVAWSDYRSNYDWDIFGARINSRYGMLLDTNGIAISTAANAQEWQAVAFDGTNYLVVWQGPRNKWFDYDIYGTRVSQTGTILDPNGIAICTAESSQQYGPSVTFDGTNYFVVWHDYRNNLEHSDIYGARVNQSGLVLDTNGITISTSYWQKNPVIAFDGTNYLVVWEELHGRWDIYGIRVNQAGQILDTNCIPISTADHNQRYPSIAFGGTDDYLIVWQDDRSVHPNPPGTFHIFGARVNIHGVVMDTNGIAISTITEQYNPSIAFDGINYFVVWENGHVNQTSIYGTRVTQEGIVLDTNGIQINAPATQRYPSIVFDGINYFVVWENRIGNYLNICGAVINLSGVVLDSFPVSTQQGMQRTPALATGTNNRVLITYSGWTNEYQGRIYNTNRIWGKFYPFIGIEEENSEVKIQRAKFFEVYPNPAKGVMRVRCPLSVKEIRIYDITGRIVKTFSDRFFASLRMTEEETISGQRITENEILWDCRDNSGKKLPAGVYICHLKTTEDLTQTKELIILR